MFLGGKLRSRRKYLGLTLMDVAKAVGVAEATVQRWESGNIKMIKGDKLKKLSVVLQISLDELSSMVFDESPSQATLTAWDKWHNPGGKLKLEAKIAELVQARYGKEAVEVLAHYDEINPQEWERLSKLIAEYARLDNDNRLILYGRIMQIIDDMLGNVKL